MGDPQASRPNCCRQVGLECDKCVRGTAGSIAALNENVGPDSIFRLFRSIYSDTACHPMEAEFRKGYEQAVEERLRARGARLELQVHQTEQIVERIKETAPVERRNPRRLMVAKNMPRVAIA